jgi:hypothetical protein
MSQLILPESFVQFLKAVNKINDAAILSTTADALSCLIGTPDNTCFLYGSMPCKSEYSGFLNMPSLAKLTRALDHVNNEFAFKVNNNNLEYKSPMVRFKYHLLDNGILSQPLINIKKIQSFEYDISFTMGCQTLTDLCKASSFANDSNKLYLSCDGKLLHGELTDKSRHNIDSIELVLGEFSKPFDAVPINLDFIRSLSYTNNSNIAVRVNEQHGVVCIDIFNDNYKLKYITSAFTS